MSYLCPRTIIAPAVARAIAPRRSIRVSEWAAKRVITAAESQETGEWRNDRNPLLVEPMDCMSVRSPVRDIVCMWPIQFGKTMVASNALGYTMTEDPCPIMVCLPGEATLLKWVAQKLNPMLDNDKRIQRVLASTKSRDATNTRTFKEFAGNGQLYIEHAGSPSRLKSSSIKKLIVDELDEFAYSLTSGDDPVELLDGRTSAFPSSYKRLYISTPTIAGVSRIAEKWEESDQRRWYVECPDCGHHQPLEWSGLHWTPSLSEVWYMCRACEFRIEEHQKTQLIAGGGWVPENPGVPMRGYTANCLYYPMGLGLRWHQLADRWRKAQGDTAKLKTFINDRLAEPWGDKKTKQLRQDGLGDRVEVYRLRTAPRGVLAITAGVDTQDDRLAVQILGWGRDMVCWVLDYVELAGDPAEGEVWAKLTDLLNRPIAHASGALLNVEATAIDAAGHRTDHVYNFVRSKRIRRPMAIFGARPNNAPILSKAKLVDVNYMGQLDKRGVRIYQVGTVRIKDALFQRLGADTEKEPALRMVHLSHDLDDFYLGGLISETFNPKTNRYDKVRGGGRNEPLDTWVYAYAAAHHHDVRLHRHSAADWDNREKMLFAVSSVGPLDSRETSRPAANDAPSPVPAQPSDDSRETQVVVQGPLPPPMAVRSAIDRIVSKRDREPGVSPSTEELAEWRAATTGTAEERAVLVGLLAAIGDGALPMRSLDHLLVQRARDLLFVNPKQRQHARRPRRGVRNGGIR